jgi:hypothetical protein
MKINILGSEWELFERTRAEDEKLNGCMGYSDHTLKHLVALNPEGAKEDFCNSDAEFEKRRIIRHEIIHAFLYESGLSYDAVAVNNWACNCEMIDWFAIQAPKIYAAFATVGCLN